MRIAKSLMTAVHRYFEYRRILGELTSLTRREADDLGISSADMPRIARQAAWGH